jgi:pyochelin biosynthesis protein PchC
MSAGLTTDRWVKQLTAAGGSAQVVCFPHSGGAASSYRPLAAELDGHLAVVAVQYPGRQDRGSEPVVTDLHELADRTAAALPPADVPRVFFGHSMGAILAYEVAQRLGGRGPAAFVASARPAPSRVRPTTAYRLDDVAFVAELVRLGGTEAAVLEHPELRALLLPTIRGDYRASETYRRRDDRPLSCPLLALAGADDPVAPVGDVLAWSEHTVGSFRMETFPGGHFYLRDHWAAVARLVRALAP